MSIAFILRMISNTISGKGGHPQSINEEIERAKKRAAKRIYRAKVRAEDELGELDRVRITLMAGDMKKFTKEFSEIKNIDAENYYSHSKEGASSKISNLLQCKEKYSDGIIDLICKNIDKIKS